MNKRDSQSALTMTSVRQSLCLTSGTALSAGGARTPPQTLDGRTATTHVTDKETQGPEKVRQVPQVTQQGLSPAVASGVCSVSQDLLSKDQTETLMLCPAFYHPAPPGWCQLQGRGPVCRQKG